MRSLLKKLLRRSPARQGQARSRFRDPRFVSFLAQSNRRTLDTDFQDAVLRGRRILKQAMLAVVAAGCVWVLVESAKALTLF
jgi:hypothetical protein